MKTLVMPVHSFIKTSSSKITSFDFVVNDENDIILFWLDSLPTNNLQRIRMGTKTDFDEIKDSGFDGTNSMLLTADKSKDAMLKALSVDWITSKIYLIENDMIMAIDYDGKNKKTIIDAGANSWDLVLDPDSRKIFWSSMLRTIYVASMDGAAKKRFVTEHIEFASGLTVDYPSRRLYWCDIRKATIETVNLEGLDRQVVRKFSGIDEITQLPVSPMKLDIFQDELYVIMTNKTIYKLNKFGWRNDYEDLNNGPHKFKASHIKIIHTYKRNFTMSNPCRLNPCDKTALCFLSSTDPSGRTCNCPDHLFIQKNGTQVSCLSKSEIPSLCYKNCVNGGRCKYVNDSMVCECTARYEGEYCEQYICANHCKNHGHCSIPNLSKSMTSEQLKAKRICTCTAEWKGPLCEIASTVCKVSFLMLCLSMADLTYCISFRTLVSMEERATIKSSRTKRFGRLAFVQTTSTGLVAKAAQPCNVKTAERVATAAMITSSSISACVRMASLASLARWINAKTTARMADPV